jgi:hypothetical protein
MLSAGICVAAAVLGVSMRVQGHVHAALSDFSVTWVVVGMITLVASPICARFGRGVGDDMSGKR